MICRAAALGPLAVTNTFTLLRLLSMNDREKDVEILALRHQLPLHEYEHEYEHAA